MTEPISLLARSSHTCVPSALCPTINLRIHLDFDTVLDVSNLGAAESSIDYGRDLGLDLVWLDPATRPPPPEPWRLVERWSSHCTCICVTGPDVAHYPGSRV